MKLLLFSVSLVLMLLIGIRIFTLEFSKLSEYGRGYLTGNVILLIVLIFAVISTGKKLFKDRSV